MKTRSLTIIGIVLMTIGVALFYNFFMVLVIGGFVVFQPDSSITVNQFFEMMLEIFVNGWPLHLTGIVLITLGILIFEKKILVKENEN